MIDLPATINNSGQNRQLVNLGELQAVDIVQSSDRSRLVLTMQKMQQFEIQKKAPQRGEKALGSEAKAPLQSSPLQHLESQNF